LKYTKIIKKGQTLAR